MGLTSRSLGLRVDLDEPAWPKPSHEERNPAGLLIGEVES